MIGLLTVASAFLAEPAPLEMPRAEAYLVREDGVCRLEDRYSTDELWYSRTVDGRWIDGDGRIFTVATLRYAPPVANTVMTRHDYVAGTREIGKRSLKDVREAIVGLSPIEVAEKGCPPRQLPRGYKDVDYYQGTNESVIVCAYLPKEADTWRLAIWELAEGDVFDEAVEMFEDEFLAKRLPIPSLPKVSPKDKAAMKERALLRADARHSVSAYDNWRVTDSDEFSVLDAMPGPRDFIVTLTNDLKRMRMRYAEIMPTKVDGSNVLAVARIFASREDYLAALSIDDHTNMEWSAAYWSPSRRELVAYLPDDDHGELLRTIRHEAFHQYLSYATAMISASPWLNEGYAQYFEADERKRHAYSPDDIERLSKLLPALMAMDYGAFYAGSDAERRLHYELALMIAIFIEEGAPKVRFDPFKNLKRDYFEELFRSHDMRKATAAAMSNQDNFDKFIYEWSRFWKNR